ncbi:MAG: hypothetical protein P8X42_05140 [Calditrichaceae bacterium]
MKRLVPLLLTLLGLLLQYCGQDILEQGKQAFAEKRYNEAVNLLTSPQIKPGQRTNKLDEITVLAYMYRGKELYNKTRNIKSFSGNYKSAETFLPDTTTPDFNARYSQLLTSLAEGYSNAKAENELEQDMFNKKSIEIVNLAIKYDSSNTSAHELHIQLKDRNFINLLKKANSYYSKAKKLDDADLYFAAEAFLNDAMDYDPDNEEVKILRRKIRKSTLGILNYNDGISLAVTDQLYDKGKLVMLLAVKNYENKSVQITPQKIELTDIKGNKYSPDTEEMKVREIFGQKCIKSTKLDRNNPYTEGIIAFDVPKDIIISYIALEDNNKEITRKYFR